MTPRSLAWIAQATGGQLLGSDRQVDAVATDTRALPGTGVRSVPLSVAVSAMGAWACNVVSSA